MPDENDVMPNEEELMLMSVVDDEEYMNLNLTQIHDREGIHEITITGSVNGENDKAPEGTISVTIPTALAFTVNNNGEVGGTSLNIVNNGTEKVEIYAYQFIDGNGIAGINVVKQMQDRTNEKTNKVVLNISGNEGTAGFVSYGNEIYDAKNPSKSVSTNDGVKIASLGKIGEQNTGRIELTGAAGKDKSGATALREQFTLKLKVKKAVD